MEERSYLPDPLRNLNALSYRCGRNGTASGVDTDVATLAAGSKVGFQPTQAGQSSFHDGPLQAYLAKSPEQTPQGLKKWDADGAYFKIAERGPDGPGWFSSYQGKKDYFYQFNFSIPAVTPPGFYILRIESVYPKPTFNTTQLYVNCAQVEITGPGGSHEPGPTVRFPGAFDEYDEGKYLFEKVVQLDEWRC
ncbi:glycoside hydrolase [Massariosphaeria phaeospora]|uniref:lytic cellulose monooxygenase (C4-dehydrogenating) n=1 Tax=Massariosphaeria phaeospora TaxID=100035 RepID=A0A7C8M612_9PLEO|nr:glycoside hydrolase [Massariosphaeria phaeospora]